MKVCFLSMLSQLGYSIKKRGLQGHHEDSNASVPLYSRDDVWGALDAQKILWSRLHEGWRPRTPQARGGRRPLPQKICIEPICVMFASAALRPAFSPCGLGDSTVSRPSDSTFASTGEALSTPAERTLVIPDDPSVVREDVPSSSSEEDDTPQQGPSKKSKAMEVEESIVARAASGICHAGVVREDGLGSSLQWSDGRVVTVRPKCGARARS